MKSYKKIFFAAAAVAFAAMAFAPQTTRAQDIPTTTTTSPIVVQQKPTKAVWMHATVVHADAVSLIVRERDNQMAIHTFTYSDQARDKMQDVIAAGGYQNGDNIRVLWMPGTEQAIRFKGRPSKAI
jgi:hypothetical protein